MTEFAQLVDALAARVGTGPAVLLIALTAGGACWVVGMTLILLEPVARLRELRMKRRRRW